MCKVTKERITLEVLEIADPCTIIASGTAIDGPEGLHMTGSGEILRWVAVTGYVGDWCIYTHSAEHSEEYIMNCGDKVCGKDNIYNVVDIDDATFAQYRY